ncbi:MAG: hypothetical protein K0R11_161 [Acidimicrobiales bacterium]|jgi:hypothetical protein|nr:hypothetical protein [Acidimicrobiales bacterium]
MRPTAKRLARGLPVIGLSGAVLAGLLAPSGASSHREAPLISQDPVADLTDVYAFRSPDAPDTLTLIANVSPFENPAGGPNFNQFGDDVRYRLNVDNDGDAVPDIRYEFDFQSEIRNPDTFLYNTSQVTSLDDPDLNRVQTYSVSEWRDGRRTELGRDLQVAPANVGERSTPNYEAELADPAVRDLGDTGMKVFAGPRDDPFFADLGKIFDLGGLGPFNEAHVIPKPTAPGEDYLAGFNVHTIALQVPIDRVVEDDPVIGVYATTLRSTTRTIAGDRAGTIRNGGRLTEVSRLGQPLVNEVVVPLGAKDKFNASRPRDDAQFIGPVLDPELGRLIPQLYPGVEVPSDVPVDGVDLGGREDIATIFLTGIAGINQPANVVPSEMLRINTSMDSGFPNGRTLTDDVIDLELRALAAASALGPKADTAPNNQLGDGVDANDRPFLDRFPYVGLPTAGTD